MEIPLNIQYNSNIFFFNGCIIFQSMDTYIYIHPLMGALVSDFQ